MSDSTLLRPRPQLRERLYCLGPACLSSAELLAILLGTGTPGVSVTELANSLLAEGELDSALFRDPEKLRSYPGVGEAQAARILAALELGRRACTPRLPSQRACFSSKNDVAEWAKPKLAGLDHEELWLLCLDAKNRLKSCLLVAMGGSSGCVLAPRDVLRPAVRSGASGLILVHNHPSGDPNPSEDDVLMTRALARACQLVGIPLLDHVVVASGGSVSIMDFDGCARPERGPLVSAVPDPRDAHRARPGVL